VQLKQSWGLNGLGHRRLNHQPPSLGTGISSCVDWSCSSPPPVMGGFLCLLTAAAGGGSALLLFLPPAPQSRVAWLRCSRCAFLKEFCSKSSSLLFQHRFALPPPPWARGTGVGWAEEQGWRLLRAPWRLGSLQGPLLGSVAVLDLCYNGAKDALTGF